MAEDRRDRIAQAIMDVVTRDSQKDTDYFPWAQGDYKGFAPSPNFEDRREVEMTQPERYAAGTQGMLYDNESRMIPPQIPPMNPLAQQLGAGSIQRPAQPVMSLSTAQARLKRR